ncbi:MAG: hypothetical protein LBG98_00540 [Puniceicoccales bacterium]|nr:hypothetical protein [Puniceicoccales bacterium]
MKEQIVLTVCMVILLCIIIIKVKHKWENISALRVRNTAKEALHEEWKKKKPALEQEFHDVIQHVLKQEKVDKQHLMEIVETAAREAKVRYEVDPPVTEKNGIFENHKTTVRLQNASMDDLIAFDEKVEHEQSNIRVDKMEIVGDHSGSGNISTSLTISVLGLPTLNENEILEEVAVFLETPELLQLQDYGDPQLPQQLQQLNTYE